MFETVLKIKNYYNDIRDQSHIYMTTKIERVSSKNQIKYEVKKFILNKKKNQTHPPIFAYLYKTNISNWGNGWVFGFCCIKMELFNGTHNARSIVANEFV